MRLFLAYWGVVLIWTTTPLAIKLSTVELSFVFAATARMTIGGFCLLLLMLVTRQSLAWHGKALQTYFAVALQLYLSLLLTYWSAQFIPSGWVSVIFGLSPFMTAFLAAAFLQERSLGWAKLFSYCLGISGLLVMFNSALDLNSMAIQGMLGVLLATFLHAASAVWVKRINAQLATLPQISGGMLLGLPLYWATWYWLEQGQLPVAIPDINLWAIAYLGLIATPLGLAWYYYVLSYMPATHVAMINLLTPVLSLWLGYSINQEPITEKTVLGTGLILLALALHNLIDRFQRRRKAMPA